MSAVTMPAVQLILTLGLVFACGVVAGAIYAETLRALGRPITREES